jgi:hypothetical protein
MTGVHARAGGEHLKKRHGEPEQRVFHDVILISALNIVVPTM